MLKVLAAVLAVLSAAISITIYTATLPDVQKQAADNSAAIESNETYIKTVDDALEDLQDAFDGLDTRLETLEGKHLYRHAISLQGSNFKLNLTIYNDNNQTANTAQKFSDIFKNRGSYPVSGVIVVNNTYFTATTMYMTDTLFRAFYYNSQLTSSYIELTVTNYTDNVYTIF